LVGLYASFCIAVVIAFVGGRPGMGIFKLGRFITFIPQSVIIGFVNALAILIFMAQIQHFVGQSWLMYLIVITTLAIIYILPKMTKAVPSALVAIIIMTVVVIYGGFNLAGYAMIGQSVINVKSGGKCLGIRMESSFY
jgi:SulP family sulfate permease